MIIERTKNTIRNYIWGCAHWLVAYFLPFSIRTAVIYVLGVEYLGIGSLFGSILSVLNMAELGFGSAIVYNMYKPVAEDNYKEICALLQLYRKIYFYMGLLILCSGLIIMPFINYFINGYIPEDVNIYVVFFVLLCNTVASYWVYAYKSSILIAHQRNDIISKISICIKGLNFILCMIAVVIFENFYFYVSCGLIINVATNIVTAKVTGRKYPYLKPIGVISKDKLDSIKKQVWGLLTQKLAFASRNAFDSIAVSTFLGLALVGIYNNYMYVLTACTSFIALIYSSMSAGVGNAIVKESKEWNHTQFDIINLLYMWVASWVSICIMMLIQPFMHAWVGIDFMLSFEVVMLFAVYFYIMKMTDIVGMYIGTIGAWGNCKKIYAVEAIGNLILNFSLGRMWGIAGIIFASLITTFVFSFVFISFVLYRHYFIGYSFRRYMYSQLKYFILFLCSTVVSYGVVKCFDGLNNNLVLQMFCYGGFSIIIPNLIFYLGLRNDKTFHMTCEWIKRKRRVLTLKY